MLFLFLFGIANNFYQAIIIRFFFGFLNGIEFISKVIDLSDSLFSKECTKDVTTVENREFFLNLIILLPSNLGLIVGNLESEIEINNLQVH